MPDCIDCVRGFAHWHPGTGQFVSCPACLDPEECNLKGCAGDRVLEAS
ncbi:MAG: hypothetical protein Q8S13_07430 [Dehalococcoidia bacterium]|nr:hypothetical protein [Dehalococcoidia bacterium]